jgi:NAD(P)H-dependent FMN reductase
MKILAISGSLRASSTNSMLVRAIVNLAPANLELTIYDELGELPHFSPDIDGDNTPASVSRWRGLLQSADGVLICTPEYAYGMPGSLKNALDWTVSSGEFLEKPVAVLSASPNGTGGGRAHASLLLTLTALSAKIVEGSKLVIPLVQKKLNPAGEIIDPDLSKNLYSVLLSLGEAIESKQSAD